MKKIFLLLIIPAAIFNACKKGEDDPFISLRSRQARVVGDWKVTSSKTTVSYTNSGSTQVNTWIYTFDGSTYSTIYTDSAGTRTSNTPGNPYEYIFEKNGSYTVKKDTIVDTGSWNFTSGVGDLKNKSQLMMYPRTTSNGTTYTGYYYRPAVYDLKELRNKKIVLYSKYSYDQAPPNQDGSTESEIVLEIK